MKNSVPLLPTSVVGSYTQPDWLIDREALASGSPPRSRRGDLWRVDNPRLSQAQDDATVLAIRDQERAGIDVDVRQPVLSWRRAILETHDFKTNRDQDSHRQCQALGPGSRNATTLGRVRW